MDTFPVRSLATNSGFAFADPAEGITTTCQQGNQRAKRRKLNKEARVALALAELQPYLFGEWLVFYTDGSSVRMDLVGWVGGFGVYYPQLKIKDAMPNPEGERQTNNAAELFAVLWVWNTSLHVEFRLRWIAR